MKMTTALALALVAGVLGLAGVSNEAYAVNANHGGPICRNYNAPEVADIDYLTNGVRNLNPNSRYVICPLVRSPTSTNVVNLFVDGSANSGTTISCTLFSYDFTGRFLGSQSFPAPRTGVFDQFLTVPGSFWGTANVLCLLPGNAAGLIYDIDVEQ